MKRWMSFVVFAGIASGWMAFADYNPYSDNALADVRLRVIDELGLPIPGVMVTAAFYIGTSETTGKEAVTKSDGIVEARYPCNGEFKVWARKTGCYDTFFKTKDFITLPFEESCKKRRWSEGTVEIPVIVKKIRSPTEFRSRMRDHWTIPATNITIGLDLELLDWCAPYGKGTHQDMTVCYEAVEHPEDGWMVSFWRRLTLAMPNGADGFYQKQIDKFSHFRYDYNANTNAAYSKTLVMETERRKDQVVKNILPRPETYWIFRTRTQTNELGRIIHANYGRIAEKPGMNFGLTLRTWFNPTDNDTNLEGN